MGTHHRTDPGTIHKTDAHQVNEYFFLPRLHQVLELISKSADRRTEDKVTLKIQDGYVALGSNIDVHCHLA